jgi:hypothetical protein
MHLYNCIWVVLLVSRLNLPFLSPMLSRGIDKVLVCLYPYGFDNPRNTLRWKLLQLTSVRLQIILFGLRTTNNFASVSMNLGSCATSAFYSMAWQGPQPTENWGASIRALIGLWGRHGLDLRPVRLRSN